MTQFTIGLIGEVSSGKSSLLNAIAGGYISNASLQRETFHPEWFQFAANGDDGMGTVLAQRLEVAHAHNESSRKQIHELKEESVVTVLRTCDDAHQLPSRIPDMDRFNVLDFPGINDAEDVKELFMKSIESNIGALDLLIYVTSADKAFVSKSEIEGLEKIKNMIRAQADNGKFIDLIVVVNKFDDSSDRDLNEIFDRIRVVDRDHIFRVSSHKILINQITSNKLDLYIPSFMKKELQTILRNTNVGISQALKDSVNHQHTLSHKHIQAATTCSSFDDTVCDRDTTGDYDDLFGAIVKSSKQLKPRTAALLSRKFNELVYAALDNSMAATSIDIFNALCDLRNKCIASGIPDGEIYNTKVLMMMSPSRADLILMIFQYNIAEQNAKLNKEIIAFAIDEKDRIDIKTHMLLMYMAHEYEYNIPEKWALHVFSNALVYTNIDCPYYRIYDKITIEKIEKRVVSDATPHESWFVNNILRGTSEKYKTLRVHLHLSVMPHDVVKCIIADGALDTFLKPSHRVLIDSVNSVAMEHVFWELKARAEVMNEEIKKFKTLFAL